jgi:hypothetical protein
MKEKLLKFWSRLAPVARTIYNNAKPLVAAVLAEWHTGMSDDEIRDLVRKEIERLLAIRFPQYSFAVNLAVDFIFEQVRALLQRTGKK